MATSNNSEKNDSQKIVSITDWETLSKHLENYNDEKLRQIAEGFFRNKEYESELEIIANFVVAYFEETREEVSVPSDRKSYRSFRQLFQQYNAEYLEVEKLIKKWVPEREKMLKILTSSADSLDNLVKCCTMLRLLSSSVDTVGAISGLTMQRLNFDHSNYAFLAASSFGFLGLVSTLAEVTSSKRTLKKISDIVAKDEEMFEPIVEHLKRTEDLDKAVQEIFPYGIDKRVVQDIQKYSAAQDSYLKIFKAGFVSNVSNDTKLAKDKSFLFNLKSFAMSPSGVQWWNWIYYREHPINLEYARMLIQKEFDPTGCIFMQSIPALPLEQQRLFSLPVGGRLILNCLTIYDSIGILRAGCKYENSAVLRKHIKKLQEQLDNFKKMIVEEES